jgi:integrase
VASALSRPSFAFQFYSFARISAVLKLKVEDYYHNGVRRRLRLHEKGGKEHEMPVHHLLEQILDEYIVAAGLQSGQPLFQSVNSAGKAVTGRALNRYNACAAIRKRAKAAGFLTPVGCHTWRATGITIYLENDGRLEHAQQMAGHESPRTTHHHLSAFSANAWMFPDGGGAKKRRYKNWFLWSTNAPPRKELGCRELRPRRFSGYWSSFSLVQPYESGTGWH